ncbi:MAG: maleylpyruvate isomerase N-terminal domain-containing protein [Streptosporangiaceae bacterium]
MRDRTDQIISNVDRVNSELIDFLAHLTDADLATPCDNPAGPTVGAIVTHVGEGSPEVFRWLTSVIEGTASPDPAPSAMDDHAHDHDHEHSREHADGAGHDEQVAQLDPAAMIELMRAGKPVMVGLLSSLTDEQLDRTPPAAAGITDGTRTLFQVISDMVEHQAEHLADMRAALAARAGSASAHSTG